MPRHRREQDEPYGWLREPLQAEADRHQPDRNRIWARVEAALGEAEPGPDVVPLEDRPRRRGLRVAGAALITAGAVAASSVAVIQLGGDGRDTRAKQLAEEGAATRSASPTSATPTSATPTDVGPPPPNGWTSATPSGKSTASKSPKTRQPALLDAVGQLDPGSNDYWARDTLRLRVRRTLDRLSITIRVDRTERVAYANKWTNLNPGDFDITHQETGQAIVYRFVLKPGRKIRKGEWIFAVEYSNGPGHDSRKDTFAITAAAGDDPEASTAGTFPRR